MGNSNIQLKRNCENWVVFKLYKINDILPNGTNPRDCYLRFQMKYSSKGMEPTFETAKFMQTLNISMSPYQCIKLPVENLDTDTLVIRLMDYNKWWDDVEMGCAVISMRGVRNCIEECSHEKIHFILSENGQLCSTHMIASTEIISNELASKSIEQRVYEYERYVPFLGWSKNHLYESEMPY